MLGAATAAQGNHWVPVATGPDNDPTGLYVDKDSLKGTFPERTIWEKFVNSYREQKLSLVEFNCAHDTWRALSIISRSPNGTVLKSEKSRSVKTIPVAPNSSQASVRRMVCEVAKGKVAMKRKPSHS